MDDADPTPDRERAAAARDQGYRALGVLPGGAGGGDAGHAVVWVVDGATLAPLARWDAPGPVDKIALGPGGGPLVELVTPEVGPASASRGPVPDWVTPLWFVDEGSGLPLEIIGQLRGPGSVAPVLLAPVAGTFAGF